MSIANNTENNILKLIFNATAWADWAMDDSTSPHANIGVALHTADPGETGTMSTSEVAYTNYARVNVPRTTATPGWAVTANSVSPTANIDFPAGGVGASPLVTHFAVGSPTAGAVDILWSGTVTPNITCGNGVTPRLTTASTITLD